MRGPDVPFWIQQLAYRGPILLIYLVAFVMAIIYWNRARTASILTMLGVSICGLSSIVIIVLQTVVVQSPLQNGANRAQIMMGISMTGTCAHAIGLALLVAAIFAGRNQYAREPE